MKTKHYLCFLISVLVFFHAASVLADSFIMPDLTGLTKAQATDRLDKASGKVHVYLRVFELNSDKAPNGKVYHTKPSAGKTIHSDQMIDMYVAKNSLDDKNFKKYPDVIGMDPDKAVETLKKSGFTKIIRTYYKFEQAPKNSKNNTVIYSSLKNNGAIILTILKDHLIPMPDVTGMDAAKAEKLLKDTRCINEIKHQYTYYSKKQTEHNHLIKQQFNRVIRQIPIKGTLMDPRRHNSVWLYIAKPESEKMVKVPFMAGYSGKNAIALLKSRGLVPQITYKPTTSTALSGKISTRTDPEAGTLVKFGSHVKFTIYQLKPRVPSLRFHGENEAAAMLKRLGFKVKKSYKSTSVKDNNGKVAGQNPAANTQLDPGSTVNIVIYRFDTIKIANLTGMTEHKAINFLTRFKSSLKYKIVYENTIDRTLNGKVCRISPPFNSAVRPGTTITLYVKKLIDTVPHVIGKPEVQAVNELKQSGFTPRVFYVKSGHKGKVVNQSPVSGSSVSGPAITVFVGQTDRPATDQPGFTGQLHTVPPVVGRSVREARSMVAANGLEFIVHEVRTEKFRNGIIVNVRPPVGTHIRPGTGQPVMLFAGTDFHTVPDVLGMNAQKAAVIIKRHRMYARYGGNIKTGKKHVFFKRPSLIISSHNSYTRPENRSPSKAFPPNAVVIAQKPAPGSPKNTSTIYLTLATKIKIPGIVGKPFDQAIQAVHNSGLRYTIEYVRYRYGRQDRLVLASDPRPNSIVSPGTVVRLTIGRVPSLIPDVTGKKEKKAVEILNNAGLSVEKTYMGAGRTDLVVIAQSQNPGAKRTAGNIRILLGPKAALASISNPPAIKKPAARRTKSMQLKKSLIQPGKQASSNSSAGNTPEIDRAELNAIRNLYEKFKSAYENQDEYELVSLVSENWGADDGTTISDLEDNLRNMFSVYDSVQYRISDFNVQKKSSDLFIVSYNVTITGQIFDTNIIRKEKSSVAEEVVFENNVPKIGKTLSGRFWYRQ